MVQTQCFVHNTLHTLQNFKVLILSPNQLNTKVHLGFCIYPYSTVCPPEKTNFSCPPVLYIYSAKDLFLFPACLQLFQYQIFQEKKKQREKIREKYTHSSTAADYVISAPENTSVLLLSVVQKNSRNKNFLFYFGTSYSTEDMVAHTLHICTGCFWVRI